MEFDLENPLPTTSKDVMLPVLFRIERDHMPSTQYLRALNSSSLLSMRGQIVSSIFHSSRNFHPFLSYLAINYMDRFLSVHSIPEGKPWILKLVAVSCVSLALKMSSKTDFSVSDLLNESGFMQDSLAIQRMEMLILGALEWRMRSVNPFSFVDYFISFSKSKDKHSTEALKDRATEIILKAQNDVKLLDFKPSVISASALLLAANQLFPVQFPSYRDTLCSCSDLDKENLLHCYDLMEEYELGVTSSSCTPTNVLDLQSFSSSISISQDSDEGSRTKKKELKLNGPES